MVSKSKVPKIIPIVDMNNLGVEKITFRMSKVTQKSLISNNATNSKKSSNKPMFFEFSLKFYVFYIKMSIFSIFSDLATDF